MPTNHLYGNVSDRFVPEALPDLTFGHPMINYVHNNNELNAAYEILDRGIEENGWGENTALVSEESDRDLSYSDLQSKVDKMAGALKKVGVEPADRVVWRFGVGIPAFITQLATWKIGAITVPSVVQMRARELEYFINDTEATTVVASPDEFAEVEKALEENSTVETVIVNGEPETDLDYEVFDELIESTNPIETPHWNDPFDVASILYTGGTTGRPKGCMHSHAEVVAGSDIQITLGHGSTEDDVYFCPAPMGHAFGNDERIFPLRVGASVVLKDHPTPPETIDLIEEHDVTVVAIVGAIMNMVMNDDDTDLENRDFSSVRLFRCAGQGTTEDGYQRWLDLTGLEPLNEFGMTPMLGWFVTSFSEGEPYAPMYSMGNSLPGYEIKLVETNSPDSEVEIGEPGRPAVRGPTGIAYWQNIHPDMPERQDSDVHEGWSLIDDVWEKREDGTFWYQNRLDNMISTGGRQIAPGEVEEVLSEHDRVTDVAVIGQPHHERGEIVKAFVVTSTPVEDEEALIEELQTYAKEEMAPYKYPRNIELVRSLPVDDVGKIQYADLEERATEEAEEEGFAP